MIEMTEWTVKMHPRVTNSDLRRRRILIRLLLAISLMIPRSLWAQGGVPGVGYSPEHDYSESAVDSVDMDSGNLMLHIPIVSYKQRGKLADFTLTVRYNALQYTATDDFRMVVNPYSLLGTYGPLDTEQNFPYWTVIGGGVQIVRANTLFGGGYDIPYFMSNGEPNTYRQDYIEDPTGGQHALYLPTGSSHSRTIDGSGIEAAVSIGPGTGGILDSSGVHHSADADTQGDGFFDAVSDPSGNAITPVTKTVAYTAPGGSTSWNITQVDHWTDSVGRIIPAPIRGGNLPNNSPGCESLAFPSSGGGPATYQFCYTNIGVATHFGSSRIGDIGPFPNPFLTSIILPNQTAYTFAYDDWGALHQIGLPDGGTVTYEWGTSLSGVYAGRGLISRTLDPGNGAPARTWTYCAAGDTRTVCAGVPLGVFAVRDPNGNDTWRNYNMPPPNFGNKSTVQFEGAGSASGGTILKSVLTTYCTEPANNVFFKQAVIYQHKVCRTDTTLSDGETYSEITNYDNPLSLSDPNASTNVDSTGVTMSGTGSSNLGIPLSETITAFGPTSAGPNVKTTTTQYLWQDDPNYYQANFMRLPSSVTTTAGDGTTVLSKDTYNYDESPSPQGYYGNRTSDTKWVAGSSSVKTTAVYNANGMVTDAYDGNSNANQTGQPGNHVTTIYDTTGLYPKQVTQSTTGSAQHTDYYSYDANTGNLTSHVDQNGSSATDTAHATSWAFDNMGRAISMSMPDGGGSTYCYTDVGGSTCTQSAAPYSTVITTKLSGSSVTTATVYYNGLGEVTSQTASNGASVSTGYDLVGHKVSVSNPYFTSADEYVTYSYDGLDRPVYKCNQDNGNGATACAPGNSYQSWTYSGPATTFKDENLNAYTRVTDSLGHLVSVTEPGGAKTYYHYDPLGNLLCVGQDGGSGGTFTSCASLTAAWRPRQFSYDGLSRLTSSYNPEAGSTTYQSGYDANSNLISKTDARNLSTTYQYDALNRLVRKTVPLVNASGAIPNQYVSNCYQYDALNGVSSGANLIGHLAAEWTQSGQTCTPSYTPSLAITAKLILSYDAVGRPVNSQQCVKTMCQSVPFAQSFSYDLAGNMTSWTDGRGLMTFNQQFDSAGRPLSVTNSVSGEGLPSVLFSAQGYTPANGLQAWNLGGFLNLSRTYDLRLRVASQAANH